MNKTNVLSNMEILGRMGEKYVSNYLARNGVIVEQALDHYDSEKDMIGDGLTIEVKTHVPFVKAKAFGINEKQLRKCKSVDRLFFINVPAPSHTFEWEGWLMEVDPKAFTYDKYKTKDGRIMVRIPMEQPAVTPVHKLDEDITKQMLKYTRSEY